MTDREQAAIELIKADTKKFYNSRIWRRRARSILRRDKYECQDCKNRGRYRRAECVHHILEIDKQPSQAFTEANLISLCKRCHNQRHDRGSNWKKGEPKFTTPERW